MGLDGIISRAIHRNNAGTANKWIAVPYKQTLENYEAK